MNVASQEYDWINGGYKTNMTVDKYNDMLKNPEFLAKLHSETKIIIHCEKIGELVNILPKIFLLMPNVIRAEIHDNKSMIDKNIVDVMLSHQIKHLTLICWHSTQLLLWALNKSGLETAEILLREMALSNIHKFLNIHKTLKHFCLYAIFPFVGPNYSFIFETLNRMNESMPSFEFMIYLGSLDDADLRDKYNDSSLNNKLPGVICDYKLARDRKWVRFAKIIDSNNTEKLEFKIPNDKPKVEISTNDNSLTIKNLSNDQIKVVGEFIDKLVSL